ncbi:NEDD4-binding protein 1-like isoform X1 [Rhodnius prolixus]|uniref:NEDD4-binding protein 1-like isoform X1 n=1 Tax=Rhodnius prolixus TaxID=13249 RepID=UPI003D187968
MEIIDLDDSSDNSLVSTKNSPSKEVKRTKRKKNIGKLNSLLKKVGQTKRSIKTLNSSDLDVTLNPEINSSPKKNNADDDKKERSGRKWIRKKRKRSSVVIVDSDYEIVESNKTLCKENNSVDSDIMCLSDSSIIELSDTEDVGIVAGLVETTKEHIASKGWNVSKGMFINENGIFKTGLNNNKKQNQLINDSKRRAETILELRERSPKGIRKKKRQVEQNGVNEALGTSSGTVTPLKNSLNTSNKVPRQSISYLPTDSANLKREGLRPIVIDGCNVAFGHGKERFSAKGIEICVDYFLRRKHAEIRAFVPQFRRRHPSTVGFHILDELEVKGYLVYTPSRLVEGRRITSYDDRFIVEYAAKTGGVVVSRDNYQDLLAENNSWSDTINFRLLQYTFVGDMIMFPQDPLGRGGPSLDKFLMF